MCRIASFAIVGVSVSWRLLRLSNSNMIVNKDNTHIRTFLMLSKRFVTAIYTKHAEREGDCFILVSKYHTYTFQHPSSGIRLCSRLYGTVLECQSQSLYRQTNGLQATSLIENISNIKFCSFIINPKYFQTTYMIRRPFGARKALP